MFFEVQMTLLECVLGGILAKVKSKQLTPNRRQRLVDHQERMRKLVQDFLNRDDNSTILPNKNDLKGCVLFQGFEF
jgi:hypothetical protein